MKVFLSKKDNETKFEIIHERDDGKYDVRFLNGHKKGEIVIYALGTIKRWWIEEEVIKKPNKKSKKVDRSIEISEIDSFIRNTYNNTWYSSVKGYKIKKNGKTIAEVYPRLKNIEVRVKKVKNDLDPDILYKDGYKYFLPVHYYVPYEADYIKVIEELLA